MSYLELAKRARRDGPNPEEEPGPSPVADIRTARIPRGENERRLIAAGWEPKERRGVVIWANPKTGFYCSQEVALHRLANPLPASPYRKLPGDKA